MAWEQSPRTMSAIGIAHAPKAISRPLASTPAGGATGGGSFSRSRPLADFDGLAPEDFSPPPARRERSGRDRIPLERHVGDLECVHGVHDILLWRREAARAEGLDRSSRVVVAIHAPVGSLAVPSV